MTTCFQKGEVVQESVVFRLYEDSKLKREKRRRSGALLLAKYIGIALT